LSFKVTFEIDIKPQTIVKNKKNILLFFASIVVIALILPDLVRHGMFMDGVQYACVSKNLADGKSSFWLPFLNSAWDRHHVHYFLEHPPLVYFLQSKFFIVCNNSFLSERLYCLATLLLSIFFIFKIWKLIFKDNDKIAGHWWLPVFLWIIIPSVSWSYKNNMHENTLSVFVLAAVYFALKSIYGSKGIIYVLIAGACIFLATLSKGLPGFFPLAIFVIHYFTAKQISLRKTLTYSLLLCIVPALIYLIIYFTNDTARFSLNFYLNDRVMERINDNPEVNNRFTILFWMFTDILVPLILCALLAAIFKSKTFTALLDTTLKKLILFFVFLALAGILPLTFTHVQRAVYFVPAMPFIAIGLAIFLIKGLDTLLEKVKEKVWRMCRITLVVLFAATLSLCIYLFGKIGRDEKEIKTARMVAEKVGVNKTIGASFEVYTKWSLQFYLLRYYDITVDGYSKKEYEYSLYGKNDPEPKIKGLTKIEEQIEELDLYKENQ
jgi:4-amino-4-deoxy-L-arabinose transferase-like glycosyltransferase